MAKKPLESSDSAKRPEIPDEGSLPPLGPDLDGARSTSREPGSFLHTDNGPCPYRPNQHWENIVTFAEEMPGDVYEMFLNNNFRRMGHFVYRPICGNCRLCIPIRVNVERFKPSKGQRRTWRCNQDLRIEHRELEDDAQGFELYQRYQQAWHKDEKSTRGNFRQSFLRSPVPTEMIHYFQGDRLVGLGFIDLLPSLISSVYFVFAPEECKRRLGVFSILYEIEYCRRLGLPWLYLGYWVPDSPKMIYKAEYLPAEVLFDDRWMPIEEFNQANRSLTCHPSFQK